MTQPFSAMIKPVGARCNLRCDYCYYRETNSAAAAGSAGTGGIGAGGCGTDSRVPGSVPAAQTAATSARIVSSTLNQLPSAPPALLTDQLLENLIRQYLAANPGPAVNFVWHGGEPSLAGLDFFRRVVQLQQKYLPTGWSCWNNLQTNGQLLNEEWCAWLAAQHFDVGLSIDGPQPSHDRYRRSADGRGSWAAAAAALRRLQQAGLQPDLLCTVNAANERAGLLTYQALRDFNTGWIEFIPVVNRTADSSVSAESVSAQGYGDFLCTVFTDWALHDLGRLDVQLFAELLRVQAGGVAGLCWLAPTCGRAVVVEADGSVYSCDHFVQPEYRLGNMAESDLAELVDSPFQQDFGQKKQSELPVACPSCAWLKYCHGGCPKDRWLGADPRQPGLGNYLCSGLQHFFGYAQPLLAEIVRLNRWQWPAQRIRQALRELLDERWNQVGRNDPCPCGSGLKAKSCCWAYRP